MAENTNPISGFADTFLSKLKEQSFVIILMLGVIYYQHRMMEERVSFWQVQYEEKDQLIDKTSKEDKEILLQRITYLQDQRDKYVEDAINELKNK
jgi:hypothetical protein|tara:strand:+ start:6863 stop:7147 length:285 start_codon:yes stop_codon:yes gene_type:complete